jgi:hypothetical protein
MTVMPVHAPFSSRDDRSRRLLAELERVVARLETTVGEARQALAELRAERCRDGGGDAGTAGCGD